MKRRKISKEQYIRLYCTEKRIRDRRVLYVSEETHRRIKRIADFFSDFHVTTASLADAILSHHIETHRELLEALEKEEREQFMQVIDNSEKSEENEDRENEDSSIS